MQKRKLGQLEVSALGLGCMGMSWAYGKPDNAESLRVLDRAFELGVNFWDTAEIYGPFKNEELLGEALKNKPRDKVVIATKFAFTFTATGERAGLDSSPAHIKKTIEGSLKRLGTDYIDLYYQHRLDPQTPIEETMGALKDLVKAGKIRHVGLSEVDSETIRRANAVHPLAAIQSEYSLWERGVEPRVLPTCEELGIGFVPYSPMGRGLLTGTIKSVNDIKEGDSRSKHPRFQEDNLKQNLELVEAVRALGTEHGASPTQVALAWLLRQGEYIVPIPGTKRVKYIEENARAADIKIPEAAWTALETKLAKFQAAGDRYPKDAMKMVNN